MSEVNEDVCLDKDGLYTGGNYSGDYIIPKDFLKEVWRFVQPFAEQLDVESEQ